MSIYAHIIYNKKTPTSQEKCGRVTKKVSKGLNCYGMGTHRNGDEEWGRSEEWGREWGRRF